MTSKVRVFLHGYLSKFHDGPITICAATAAEAIEGITTQLPGFHPDPIKGRHRIAVVGHPKLEDLYKPLTSDELHIVPNLAGGKNGGFVQILIGAALVAASFIPGLNVTVASFAFSFGAAMLLGGVMQLLFPAPDNNSSNRSRYLGAPKNTTEIGTRIPILYGEHQVYGHILSFDIQALNKAV